MSRSEQFWAGAKAGVPMVFGLISVAIAYAVMAMQAGLTAAENILMSVFVFAGASQMMSVGMLTQGAGTLSIILATLILNLRQMIMSTCIFNRMEKTGLGLRLLAAFGVVDELFAVYTAVDEKYCTFWFYLGLFADIYISWVGGTILGVVASNFLPPIVSNSLGISLYAMFIALLIPKVRYNRNLLMLALLTAGINYALQQFLPSSWSLIVATLAGAALGVWLTDYADGEVAAA